MVRCPGARGGFKRTLLQENLGFFKPIRLNELLKWIALQGALRCVDMERSALKTKFLRVWGVCSGAPPARVPSPLSHSGGPPALRWWMWSWVRPGGGR